MMEQVDRNDSGQETPHEPMPASPESKLEGPAGDAPPGTDVGEEGGAVISDSGPNASVNPPAAEEAPSAGRVSDLLAQENQALKDQLIRLRADFENFRKRTQRERNELFRRANEELVLELLPALDHFELGLGKAEADQAQRALVEGFRIVYDQLLNALTKFGLEPLPAVGQPFDPHHHEALTQMPSTDVPADVVLEELRRGYRFGDRLLRASQVVVSSGPPGGDAGAPPYSADTQQEGA